MSTPNEMPPGWRGMTLGEVAQWSSGGTPKRTTASYFGGSIPWVVIGDLNDGVVTSSSTYITEEGLRASSAKWIPPGAVLLAMYGSIGKLGIAGTALTTNQAIAHAIVNDRLVEAKYLFWYLRSIRDELVTEGKGGAQQNISQTIIKNLPIPVPPLAAQGSIVAVLEEQDSRLEAGIASLRRGQTGLRRLLDAALEAAYQQRLTPRDDHQDGPWPSVLLGSLLAEPLRNGHSAKRSPAGSVRTLTLTAVTRSDSLRRIRN